MGRSTDHVASWLRFGGGPGPDTRPSSSSSASGPRAGDALPQASDGVGRSAEVPDTLRHLYDRYREHEGRDLLTLMPRDAFRSLYRVARRRAQEGDVELARALDEGGPMELAASFVRRSLPLPPYEVWVEAYRANRAAFLERLGIDSAPSREEPVTVSVRPVGDGWYAALCVSRTADGWSGFVRFHRTEGERAWTTTNVFRGEEVDEIRERFDTFDDNTLRAFLRSVLP